MGGKKILIVSKCPTHPVIAGNCKFIFNQVELLKRMGNDVYFLFVQEKAFRKKLLSMPDDKCAAAAAGGKRLRA